MPLRSAVPLAILAIALAGCSRSDAPASQKAEAPGVPVTTAAAVAKTMPVRVRAVGNVEPYVTVAVKARVDGQITAVHFREGDEVRQGQDLFEIDSRPFQAALHQAQAALVRDRALLANARTTEGRNKDLLAQKFITQEIYDQARTNAETAAAAVQSDEAASENARLQLEYCRIRSPITGYAGKIMIQQGNLVKANDANPLVVLNQVVPVLASFAVPEQYLDEIRARQRQGALAAEAVSNDASAKPVTGEVSFVDNAADVSTGTIRLRARFANRDKSLWPGQFVNVTLTLREQAGAIVVPASTIQNGPDGQYVFRVKPDQTVEQVPVKVDRTDGDETVVAQGLAAGDRVVTTGQLRLTKGAKIADAEPAQAPKHEMSQTPAAKAP
jgi:multidrug efflux system membrane fusion protein